MLPANVLVELVLEVDEALVVDGGEGHSPQNGSDDEGPHLGGLNNQKEGK